MSENKLKAFCKLTGTELEFDEWFHKYIVEVFPDALFISTESYGSYSGDVITVYEYNGKLYVYQGHYGSCSMCGSWGEGGEPVSKDEILEHSQDFDKYMNKIKEADYWIPNCKDQLLKAKKLYDNYKNGNWGDLS